MKRSPFTSTWQQIDRVRNPERADLHLHTIYSDGTHTPETLVTRALQAGLRTIAVTDHDTIAGVVPTQQFAPAHLEVWPGVEITCVYNGRELHLLAYLFDMQHPALLAALDYLRAERRQRVLALAERLLAFQVSVVDSVRAWPETVALGRRHLARLLIDRGHATSLHQAFTRFLGPASAAVPKTCLPVAEALTLVRQAGGITSWAHPPHDTTRAELEGLANLGLHAVECVYPWPTRAVGQRMRTLATELGLAITGGSDSHDPGPRAVGAKTITAVELAMMKQIQSRSRGML